MPRVVMSPKELKRIREIKPVIQKKFQATYTRPCPSCGRSIPIGTWLTRTTKGLVHEACAPSTPQFVIGKSIAEKRAKVKKRTAHMKRVLTTTKVDIRPTYGQVRYEAYMQSKDWVLRKQQWYAANGKWCRGCESQVEIHLHHKTYRRLGHEADEDLIALCSMCHMYVHHLEKGEGYSLKAATEAVVIF